MAAASPAKLPEWGCFKSTQPVVVGTQTHTRDRVAQHLACAHVRALALPPPHQRKEYKEHWGPLNKVSVTVLTLTCCSFCRMLPLGGNWLKCTSNFSGLFLTTPYEFTISSPQKWHYSIFSYFPIFLITSGRNSMYDSLVAFTFLWHLQTPFLNKERAGVLPKAPGESS